MNYVEVSGGTKKQRTLTEDVVFWCIEKMMPRKYISRDGFGITQAAREYLSPLIQGEDYPAYKNGIPQYAKLKKILEKKQLKAWRPKPT